MLGWDVTEGVSLVSPPGVVGYSHVVEPWHEADGSQDQHGRGSVAEVFTYDPGKEEGTPDEEAPARHEEEHG